MKLIFIFGLFIVICNCNNPTSNNNLQSIKGVYKKNYILNYSEYVPLTDSTFTLKRFSKVIELNIKDSILYHKTFLYDEYGNLSSGRYQPFHYQVDGNYLLINKNKKYKIINDENFLDMLYISKDTIYEWYEGLDGRYMRINPSDTIVFR